MVECRRIYRLKWMKLKGIYRTSTGQACSNRPVEKTRRINNTCWPEAGTQAVIHQTHPLELMQAMRGTMNTTNLPWLAYAKTKDQEPK